MKLEENSQKPIKQLPKQVLGSGSNFKQKIPIYINEINLSTSLLDENEQKLKPKSMIKKIHIETQKNHLRSEHSTTLQTSTRFFLFLGRSMMENYSEIIIYEYMKADGQHRSMEMNGIKGEISCLQSKFGKKKRQLLSKKSEMIKNSKRSGSLKNTHQSTYEVILLIGTVQGYLKALRFEEIEQNEEPKFAIESIKLDYCQIVDLIGLDSSYYNGANICLVLSLTNRVYLVNFDTMSLIAYFLPTIISCEVGLGLSVNYEQQYFIQSCEGGYVIFWDLNERILELIGKSINQTKNEQEPNIVEEKKQSQDKFHSEDIYHCISPLNIFHSATIAGIKHCQLYGNLLLIITLSGTLKLLAINKSSFTHLCQNEYTSLIEYQIEDGELISDVKFFPLQMQIFVVKSWIFDGITKKNSLQKCLPVKEYQIDRQRLKKKATKSSPTKVYKPLRLKCLQNNIFPQRHRSKSSDNRLSRCYFERITFNQQLQIVRVQKIYPSVQIDCIQSLEMTQNKEIIVLRAREFYLIGSTELFNNIVDVN